MVVLIIFPVILQTDISVIMLSIEDRGGPISEFRVISVSLCELF